MEFKFLLDRIMEKSELPEEEVRHNIQLKKAEFQELINDEAAAKLIAKELGIAMEEEEEAEFLNLADLQLQKPSEANAIVRVMNIFSPKNFETERKKGKVCNIEIADTSAKAALVLWDEDVRWMEKNGLERDDVLVLKGAQVKSYNPLELHSSLLTEMQLLKPLEFISSKYYKPLPQQPAKLAQVKDLHEGEAVDIFARILQISEMREFAKEKRTGKVLNLLIADASGSQVPLVLWDYYAEQGAKSLNPGMAIKAENAMVKKTMAGVELHLNWTSNLILDPKAHNLKKEEEMLKEMLPMVRLLDMKTGGRGIVKAYLSKIDKAELKGTALCVQAEIRDEINVAVQFSGRQALEILQLRSIPKLPLELVLKLKEEYIKDKRVSMVVRKEKDRTGKVSKYFCEHVLNFI